ncbi:MAG: peptide chain release factor N(5)-glutamine methyltransferase [Anaerovibrio sp.]
MANMAEQNEIKGTGHSSAAPGRAGTAAGSQAAGGGKAAGGQPQEVWTIGRILKWTEGYFQKAGLDSPRLDAEVLLSYVLKKERIFLYVHFDQPMEEAELAAYKGCIKRRVQHQPVAYITGHKEFMGLEFKVTPATLIPRPDTEILVEAVLQRLKAGKDAENSLIADIGTGSGAICLSLLNYLPKLQAVTVDISPEALAVAEENAEVLGLSERIEFLQGDMLEPLKAQGERFSGRLSAIVSNPPYIPRGDIAGLEPDVRAFEPMGALDGGEDGLDFYRRLLADGAELLQADGFLAMEAGIHQAQQLKAMAEGSLQWGRCEIIRDLAGIERVVVLWKA